MTKTRWAIAVAAVCLAVAIAAAAYAAGQAKAVKVLTADVMRTRRLEVVDEKGKVRATLAFEDGKAPALVLRDGQGAPMSSWGMRHTGRRPHGRTPTL
jgi:hypothetical protein